MSETDYPGWWSSETHRRKMREYAEKKAKAWFSPLGKIAIFVLGMVAAWCAIMTGAFLLASKLRVHVALLAIGLSIGCSTMPNVTPSDLERLTADIAAMHSALGTIDTSKLPAKEAHALEDVRTVSAKAVTVADLLTRVAKGAQ